MAKLSLNAYTRLTAAVWWYLIKTARQKNTVILSVGKLGTLQPNRHDYFLQATIKRKLHVKLTLVIEIYLLFVCYESEPKHLCVGIFYLICGAKNYRIKEVGNWNNKTSLKVACIFITNCKLPACGQTWNDDQNDHAMPSQFRCSTFIDQPIYNHGQKCWDNLAKLKLQNKQ